MSPKTDINAAATGRRMTRGALLLGFSLGGFFDGILLHQVLQWHHLLSGVENPRVQDLQVQVLADGLFHLLMYLVAVLGVAMLWSARRTVLAPPPRMLLGHALLGFGSWHVLDALVSHWLLGIHRIRMDSPDPLFWDLSWFVVFGLGVLALGWWLRRPASPGSRGGALTASVLLAATAMLAGFAAALPPRDLSTFVVVLRPGADAGDLLDGLARLEGGILWADRSGSMWAVKLANPGDGARLYRHGALFVTGSPALLGCAAWTRESG